MNRTKLTVGIILIFILGGLTGALAVQVYYKYELHGRPPRHHSSAERTDFIMSRLKKDLDLNTNQISDIRAIVEEGEKRATEIMDGIGPEMQRNLDQMFSLIREKLDPDQQAKLDEVKLRMNKFRKKKNKR